MFGLLKASIVIAVSPERVAADWVALPEGVTNGWRRDSDVWSLPVAGRKSKIARLNAAANEECGRRVTAVYGSANRTGEALFRLNNAGNLTAHDAERTRLVLKCGEVKATIAGLDDFALSTFNVTEDQYWSAS